MSSGEHDEGTAAGKLPEGSVGEASEPAQPIHMTPAPASGPEQAEEHVRAALAAGTRTGASLSALFRAVEEMTDSLGGARDANEQLVKELEAMRQMLALSTEENASLEEQLAGLGAERDQALRELEQARSEAEKEREFLVGEQDRFLAALLDDHEQALAALRRERDQALAASGGTHDRPTRSGTTTAPEGDGSGNAKELREARRTIEKLMTERNRSREMLRRLQAQRDEAQAALAGADVDTAPLNVTVRASPNPDDVITEPPRKVDRTPTRDGRTTAPQGSRARNPVGSSERATDPVPRLAAAQGSDASRPSTERQTNPLGHANAPRRRTTERGLAAPTPPPDELRGAITLPTQTDDAPGTADGRPPLKRKPDPTSRPLGGYSLRADEIEVERVGRTGCGAPKTPRR